MVGAQAMKINAKIGGVNWVINPTTQPAPWMSQPYIVFGERPASCHTLELCVQKVTCRVCCLLHLC